MRKTLSALLLMSTIHQGWAQSAVVSVNPPNWVHLGNQGLSQNQSGGLRVQPQDGSGNDVSASHGMPVVCESGCTGGTGGSTAINDGTTGTQKAAVDTSGNLHVQPPNGCGTATAANTSAKVFSNGGSASNLLLVAGIAAQKVHLCAFNLGPVASAVNVALVEGTTTTNPCDTGTVFLGSVTTGTAATGWQLAANGGLTYGNGIGLLAQAATAADNVCLLISGAVQITGAMTYAVY